MAAQPMDYDVPHNGLEYLDYYAPHDVFHPGSDLNKGYGNDDLNAEGFAILNGRVDFISKPPTKWNNDNGGLGLYTVLEFPAYGKFVRVLHLNSMLLEEGKTFKEGQTIMKVGKSGTSYAHMHIEGWNKEMYDLQKAYKKRPFGYYPVGKSKEWVAKYTFDVLKWIEDLNEKEDWRKEEEEWMSQYLSDIPAFIASYDGHRVSALIHRAVDDLEKRLTKKK